MEGTIWGDDAMDATEAAAYCGYARQTWWQSYKEWKVPYVTVGGRSCFLKPDLDKWMAGRKRRENPHYHRGSAA
jgi:predicted DNA-binding transcriptional regulator AlpA